MEKKFVHNIAYLELGSGEPLVLLHGYLCSSTIFESVLLPLSDKYRVIIPDLPGHGGSAPIENGTHVDKFAKVLMPFIDEVCPGKFLLYGHSMGAYIALSLAEIIPERISVLGLISASAQEITRLRKKLKTREKLFIAKGKFELLLRHSIPSSFMADHCEKNAGIIRKIISEALDLKLSVINGSIDAIVSRPNRLHFLKNAGIKVIYLFGAHDSFNDPVLLRMEAEEIDKARIKLFSRSGHFCFLEEQQEFILHLLSLD